MSDLLIWMACIFLFPPVVGLFLMWINLCKAVIEEIKDTFGGK